MVVKNVSAAMQGTSSVNVDPIVECAKRLATAHKRQDPATSKILLFQSADEVRLLEVSATAPTTNDTSEIRFKAYPTKGIDCPSAVILLSPDEWRDVESGKLPLPQGWDLSSATKLL